MSGKNKHYSNEERLALVQNYFESGMSKYAFCKLHQISSCSVLRNWIKKYTLQEKTVSSPSEDITEEITEEIAEDMANRSKDDYKEENTQLKKRIKELEKALEFSKLQTEARDLMITRAEEYFNIPIRKKSGAKQ